jgi:hypothetical protein
MHVTHCHDTLTLNYYYASATDSNGRSSLTIPCNTPKHASHTRRADAPFLSPGRLLFLLLQSLHT